MTAGKDRVFLNVDTFCYDSVLSDEVAVLVTDTSSAIRASDPGDSAIRIDGPQNTKEAISRKIEYNRSISRKGRTIELERNMPGNSLNALSSDGGIVYGAYEIEDVCMKSHQDQVGYGRIKFDPDSYPMQDVYVPQISSQPIQFCAPGSSVKTYMVMEESVKAADVLGIVQDENTQSYTMEISSVDHVTVAYKEREDGKTYAQMVSGDVGSGIQDLFDDYREIPGVKYATIASFPMEGVASEYLDGNVYCIPYSGKNQYGATYSMEMGGPDELSVQRKYEGILSQGDRIYLKYRDVGSGTPYQKVEQFIPVNYNDHGRSNHKSQLFSVRIRNTGIEEVEDDEIRERIMTDVTNAVSRIANRVCPAQTQLFDVRFGDKS